MTKQNQKPPISPPDGGGVIKTELELGRDDLARMRRLAKDYAAHGSNIMSKVTPTLKAAEGVDFKVGDGRFRSLADMREVCSNYFRFRDRIATSVDAILASDDISMEAIRPELLRMIAALSEYKTLCHDFNRRAGGGALYFSSQSKFESTILEEFIGYMLYPMAVRNDLKCSPCKSYCQINLKLAGMSGEVHGEDILGQNVLLDVYEKDQDMSVFREAVIGVKSPDGAWNECLVRIPILSVECKTYVDKTMYESSVATAGRIKEGNPKSKFYMVAETYDIGRGVVLNDSIDNIFVIRKSSRVRGDAQSLPPIDPDVLLAFYDQAHTDFTRGYRDSKDYDKVLKTGVLKPFRH